MTVTGWKECLLGDVITLKRGYDLPRTSRLPGPFPVVSSSGITDYHAETKAKAPGVVTGRYGTLGQVFFVSKDYWPLNTSLYVQDFKGNDPKFIALLLSTLSFGAQNAAGAVPGVNRNHLHMMEVCVPSLPTQRRIAGILSAYDDLIENSLRRIKILEEMARRLYREWFVDSVESDSWSHAQLGDLIELKRGYDLPAKDRRQGLIPIVSSSGITGFHDAPMATGPGIVTGRCGTLGEVHLVWNEFWPLNTSLYVKDFKGTPFLYVLWLLRHILPNQKGSAAAVPALNRNDLHSLPVKSPPPSVMKNFHDFCLPLASQARCLNDSIENLRRTRDLLLPRLLSGQIDVEALPEPALSEA